MKCNEQGGVAEKFQKGDDLRNMVTTVAGAVPVVGSAISGIIKVLWADDSQGVLFNQMKEYVDKLVPALLAQKDVEDLEGTIDGLLGIYDSYQTTPVLDEKKNHLINLIDQVTMAEYKFFHTPDPKEGPRPERVLAHFIAFGTLKMVALRELYVHGKEYYGTDAARTLHLINLQNAVEKYTRAAVGIKQRAMNWRYSTLHKYQYDEVGTHGAAAFGGASKETVYYVSDDLCGWTKTANGEGDRDRVLADRWTQVQAAYGADLDLILSPIAEWRRLAEPVDRPPPKFGHPG